MFLAYEFRRWTLETKLIIAIGYSFGDEHINGILGQALLHAPNPDERKLLVVGPFENEDENTARLRVAGILKTDQDQIVIKKMKASAFMSTEMTIDKLNTLFPEDKDAFSEIA